MQKRTMKWLLFATMLCTIQLLPLVGGGLRAQNVTLSYQDFYDELSPYGQWVYDPEYGNVWVPDAGSGFRPYGSDGYWAMTEYGNMWMSSSPYSWAVYHYGRWTYNGYYGWMWVPGLEWAPAWVSWRWGGGYCGWAPLPPGVAFGAPYSYPYDWWMFVSPRYMYSPGCARYWRGAGYNRHCLNRTTIINNVYIDQSTHVHYNYGPRSAAIQGYTRQPVTVHRINNDGRRGAPVVSGNSISIYRPTVQNSADARPAQVINAPQRIGTPQATGNSTATPRFREEYTHTMNNNVSPAPGRSVAPATQNTAPAPNVTRYTKPNEPAIQRNTPVRHNPGSVPSYDQPAPNTRPTYTPPQAHQDDHRDDPPIQRNDPSQNYNAPRIERAQPSYNPPPVQRNEPSQNYNAPRIERAQPSYNPPPVQRNEPSQNYNAPRERERPSYNPPPVQRERPSAPAQPSNPAPQQNNGAPSGGGSPFRRR
ncbi:MAG: hypothetical protein EBX41_04230 [Chitinophagia bacterium]|nr:hypothetical protein [Chitinophagia bacterium]